MTSNNIVISQPDDMQFVTVTVGIRQPTQIQQTAKNKQMLTVVVGLKAGSAALDRAKELDRISKDNVNDARRCVSLMSQGGSTSSYSDLIGKVEQLSFYLDSKNNRGIFSGIVATESLMAAGGAQELSKIVVVETGLSIAETMSDIDGFSWVFFGLDSLQDGSGDLIVSHSNGVVGGI